MFSTFLIHAGAIRITAFLGILALMALWEVLAPRRPRVVAHSRRRRWPANLGITILNGTLLRFIVPGAALFIAAAATKAGWGLLNYSLFPYWMKLAAAVLLLDLTIYLQHVLFHAVPLLWRIHRMHHADVDLDVTSGGRFHTFEILLSGLIKISAVAALGAPMLGVFLFEVLLNATSMFNHSNVSMPLGMDRVLRLLLVTPDMHRVHHSIEVVETNSNFGFNLPWWDYIFRTYRAQPRLGHTNMVLGIEQFREPVNQRFDRMWLIPFRGNTGAYPMSGADPSPEQNPPLEAGKVP